jgi:hypothetical protein
MKSSEEPAHALISVGRQTARGSNNSAQVFATNAAGRRSIGEPRSIQGPPFSGEKVSDAGLTIGVLGSLTRLSDLKRRPRSCGVAS